MSGRVVDGEDLESRELDFRLGQKECFRGLEEAAARLDPDRREMEEAAARLDPDRREIQFLVPSYISGSAF